MPTVKPRLAVYIIAVAVAIDSIAAWLFSIAEHISIGNAFYWSIVTATTIGYGDITPHTPEGKVIAATVMLTVVPLFAAEFSLFTSLITAHHMNKHHENLHKKLDHIIHHSPDIPVMDNKKGE